MGTALPLMRCALAALGLALAALTPEVAGQVVGEGGLARDFTVVDRATGRPLHLEDLAGKIVVLDFFAHWCEPCRQASADLESSVRRHYAALGGNPAGLPVVVVGINVDPGRPDLTADFIRRTGMELATEDPRQDAFSEFDERNSLPLIVVINGASGIQDLRQWQVLYSRAGYEGAAVLRRLIDSVGAPGSRGAPR